MTSFFRSLVSSGYGYLVSAHHMIFAYKMNVLLGLFNNVVALLVQYFLWRAIFASNSGEFYGFEESQYLGFIGAVIFIKQFTTQGTDRRLAELIRTGDLVFKLTKPHGLIFQCFFEALGELSARLYGLVLITLLVLVLVGDWLWTSQLPLFGVSLVLAFIISFQISVIYGSLALWTTNAWGLYLLRRNLFPLLSGQVIALPLLRQLGASEPTNVTGELVASGSSVLYHIAIYSPFQAVYQIPANILIQMSPDSGIYSSLLIQLGWIVLLSLISSPFIQHILKSFNIQGA
ncbi:hypothetical protein VHA01S_031_00310 [Vibrio halioticoli NBRC 102217]|uniref:ABC transporter permease protein n=1 Tax=Vibrio halioticoli NBRC 102217 TaxID=1219072 RepID=V5F464_9VIBR|nr:ABC-2 family transporter protein [Vibrio halioticoli]GAD90019.1 hypothetical protein VHA01S_031_00310 [Vibrio halioticoli NBRC 102217]